MGSPGGHVLPRRAAQLARDRRRRADAVAAPEVTLDCPEIGGLAVRPEELRSRGIGTELVRAAEELARTRGLTTVGIGVGQDNPRAAGLYARLGYRPVTDYLDRWSYQDHGGTTRECVDACTFLVRDLSSGYLDVKPA